MLNQEEEVLLALRQAVLRKLAEARATIEELQKHGEVELTALEWEKGYARALEEVLGLEGLSLRRFPRRVTSIAARIVRSRQREEGPREAGEGTILGLSEGGCRLATRMGLAVGEIVEISFPLPRMISLKGCVLRIEETGDVPHLGVEFQEVPEDVRKALRDFCAAGTPQA